jgi:protein-disulfide isomerase
MVAQGLYAHRAEAAAEAYRARRAQAMQAPAKTAEIDVGALPGRGPADAPVVIVEYSDFECPFCQILAKGLKDAQAEKPGLFRYYFKHSPMDQACNPNIKRAFHEDACRAAYAAECARKLGKFWEMHDTMFENNKRLAEKDLLGYAAKQGLDPDAFAACMKDPATDTAIKQDIAEGRANGVDGTPTWFVNGWRVVGARRPADLINLIERAAANAKSGVDQPPE